MAGETMPSRCSVTHTAVWKLCFQGKIFQTAPGFCLGKGVNWVAQSKQMGCSIQARSLAVNFLFSTICLFCLNIGRKKSMKNRDRTS